MSEINNQVSFRNLIFSYIFSFNSNFDKEKLNNYESLREQLHFNSSLDETIKNVRSSYKNKYPNTTDSEFIDWFVSYFHHSYLSEFCSNEIQNRNDKVQNAYKNILETIYRIQTWLDEEKLRTKVEIDWLNRGGNYNLVHQTIALFCDIVLACNQKGEYYISFNLDYRCQELLNTYFTNILLRRIYEFTTDDLEPCLRLNNLIYDGADDFFDLLSKSKTDENIKTFLVPKNYNNASSY